MFNSGEGGALEVEALGERTSLATFRPFAPPPAFVPSPEDLRPSPAPLFVGLVGWLVSLLGEEGLRGYKNMYK